MRLTADEHGHLFSSPFGFWRTVAALLLTVCHRPCDSLFLEPGLTEKSEWFGGFGKILRDTPPVETSAPSGSVVLWHTKILHMRGHN